MRLRVGVPTQLAPRMARLFRSADTVWSGLVGELPGAGCDLVDDEPDVWLWDAMWELPQTDAPLVSVIAEAPWDDPDVRSSVSPRLIAFADESSRVACERSARILAPSESSRRQIVERYGFEDVDVTPWGVDHSVFRPDGPVTDLGYRYVLYVGTVLPRKGLPLLRAAMEHVEARLVVVASPALDENSPRLLEEATRPIRGMPVENFAGVDRAELAALMRGAELLCLPSLAEGFGLPVAEAMACGTPVVVSDRTALPEVAGDGGLVVPVTVDAVAEAVSSIVEDPARRAELARRALARGATFTWRRTAELAAASLRAAYQTTGT